MSRSVGAELLNAPFPEFVVQLGKGIAEAQYELDKVSLRITQLMAGYANNATENDTSDVFSLNSTDTTNPNANKDLITLDDTGKSYTLLELGFTPTFYQFVDTVLELKMAVSMSQQSVSTRSSSEKKLNFRLFRGAKVASVNASYSQKYQYSVEGSSLMRTKIVTVPPPARLEEIIREVVASEDQNTST
ncbi:hypothetical protein ABW636_04890 [Aquimarina sp. 2201CG1-2-11]|uniref:hypothetical protein n=1 Tax=Aquimarina discodermiae TaxID=3231043 RepID=UPI003462EAC8